MKRVSSLAAILLLTVAFMGCGTEGTPAPIETNNETSQTELDLNQVSFGIECMT